MAIDLEDLVPDLKTEVNPPGSDFFPTASDDEWLANLRNSFWEARAYGFWTGYTEAEGLVAPLTGTTELGRDQQQLIILFSAARIIRNTLQNTNTSFRAEVGGGAAVFEVENSATLLVAILKDIRSKIDLALAVIGSLNSTTVAYIDSLVEREESIYYGETYFMR